MNSTWREHLEYLFAGANPNSTRAAVEYKATIVPERCVSLERRRGSNVEGRGNEREMRGDRVRTCAQGKGERKKLVRDR